MNPLVKSLIASTVRKILTGIAGALVLKKLMTSDEAEGWIQWAIDWAVAMLPLAISSFWSYANEKGWRIKFLTALTQPVGTTENDVKEIIKSGAVTPTVTTPPDTIPGIPKPTDQP
jgi:hypothetical protein